MVPPPVLYAAVFPPLSNDPRALTPPGEPIFPLALPDLADATAAAVLDPFASAASADVNNDADAVTSAATTAALVPPVI